MSPSGKRRSGPRALRTVLELLFWVMVSLSLGGCGPPSSDPPPLGFSEASPDESQSEGAVGSRVAFVVYDAGETLALLPVSDILEAGGAGVRVIWVPLTPWAAQLLAENNRPFLPLPPALEEMPHVQSREGVSDLGSWEEEFLGRPPTLAVLGMVSEAQRQIAALLRNSGVPTRGLYDGFQPPEAGAIGARIADAFDEVWVSTSRVREGFAALGMEVRVVGQPTLESWRRVADSVDPHAVRRTQGVRPDQRVLLFAGQYGPGYAQVLGSFLTAMREVLTADSSLLLVLSPHPRTDGSLEERALGEAGFSPAQGGGSAAVRGGDPRESLVDSPGSQAVLMAEALTTAEVAAIADAVLTWTSTVGVQAAFLGKPVLYYSPPADFDRYLVEQGAALLADAESLERLLMGTLEDPQSPAGLRGILVSAGYVVDADEVVARRILEALSLGAGPRGSRGG